MTKRRASKPTCIACGSADTIPILYGMPGPELMADAEAGKIALGGCCIVRGQPTHECRACRRQFTSTSEA